MFTLALIQRMGCKSWPRKNVSRLTDFGSWS